MTLASTADAPPSPTSPSSPHHHLHHNLRDTPPSRQDTLSPSPSIPCSPEQQQQTGQSIRDSLQNLRDYHHHQHHHAQKQQQHLSPANHMRGDGQQGDVGSEFAVGRVGSRLSIASRSSSGGGGGGGKRGSVQQQSLAPRNDEGSPLPPDASPTTSVLLHHPVQSPNGLDHIDLMDERDSGGLMDELSFHHYSRYYDYGGDPEDDSGDNHSHDSYELIEREEGIYASGEGGGGSHGGSLSGSQLGSRGPSRTSSRGLLSSLGDILSSSREGLEWCESKGGGDMPVSRGSSRAGVHTTGSLPRSHGGSVTTIINGYTGSLPRTHSAASGQLSRTLAGSRASSRITLELALDGSPDKEDDLSSPGSPEFHENSVCEITSETGYGRHLGTITITDNVSLYTPQLPTRRPVLERAESLTDSIALNSTHRSRSNSRSNMSRVAGSRENLRDGTEPIISMSAIGTRASASIKAAKEMGQYVDYGSSQESLNKMSSCDSDAGSSMSSQTRSSTTPRPSDFHPHVSFLQPHRSTSTSPTTITSGSSQPLSQPRPHSMDFSSLHKKSLFNVYIGGRGSDSGGNTDSDICSPLEIPLPIPSSEQVLEVDEEEDESITPSQDDQLLFLRCPPDIGLITRIHGSSDEEDENEPEANVAEQDEIIGEEEREELLCEQPIIEEDETVEVILEEEEESQEVLVKKRPVVPERTRIEDEEIVVIIEENLDPFLFNLQNMTHPHELKEESPSSAEMDFTDASKDRKIDESEASERTVIERYLPEERLNKVGSKDSQISIEDIDETILDRRSSLGLERRSSYHESRKSPYLDRRFSNQDLDRISPASDKDRRPSYQEGERRSPYLEADRRSSNQDLSRRSPFDRDRTPSNSSDRSRRGSNSSDRRSSISSDRHGSISSERRASGSSDRRGSGSSDHKPSLSDIGRRTSISCENDQRSPFFDTPAFEFDPPVFEFEHENVFDSVEHDTTPPHLASAVANGHSPPGNDTEHSKSYLDQSRINVDEFTEALLPPEDSSDTFSSLTRVVDVGDGSTDLSENKKDMSPTQISKTFTRQSPKQTPQQTPQHTPAASRQQTAQSPISSSLDGAGGYDKPPKKPQRDVIIIKVEAEEDSKDTTSEAIDIDPKNSKRTMKIEDMSGGSSYESNQDSQEKSNNGDASLEGGLSGSHYHRHQDFYDDEDDHAQMSDHSSQSPDLVSEPDEYHDEYQEPEYYQPYRQMDMGYAFPSRTLSRISERSTTSEQEHEQDHVHSEHETPDNELTDSKISTPTEDKHGVDHPSDIPSDVSSDYSNSNCEELFSESKHSHSHSLSQSQTKSYSFSSVHQSHGSSDGGSKHNHHQYSAQHSNSTVSTISQQAPVTGGAGSGVGGALTAEEQENVNKFATHLFLCDLPEFCPGDDSDEFPSPPSSAFLENPHAELRHIDSYYVDIANKANKKLHEGIYDNIPVQFEGIHEVSESESGSEENRTLQEPEDDLEVLEEMKNIKELDDDQEEARLTPTPTSGDDPPTPPPHANLESPPPPPPPRAQAKLPGKGSGMSLSGGSGMAGVVGALFGAKPKIKTKSPSPPVSPCAPPYFVDSPEPTKKEGREIHLPDLPGSPPSLSSLDSPDSQVLSRLPPYLPMLPSTPPSVSSLDSPDSQIFIMQPASPPASFANPESPCDSVSESSNKIIGAEGGTSHGSLGDSTLSSEDLKRQEELRQLDIVDFGQQPEDILELNFTQQREIADLEMADLEHQRSLSGAELIEFQQQREMANIALQNLSSHSEVSDFDLSPTSPFDMLDFSELSGCEATSSTGVARATGGGSGGGGVTALDFEVIGGQLEEDRRRSRPSDSSRDWS